MLKVNEKLTSLIQLASALMLFRRDAQLLPPHVQTAREAAELLGKVLEEHRRHPLVAAKAPVLRATAFFLQSAPEGMELTLLRGNLEAALEVVQVLVAEEG